MQIMHNFDGLCKRCSHYLIFKPLKPTDGVWCEGKPMLDYILQLSFIYTIKGHVNVLYNHGFKGKPRGKKEKFSCINMATSEK